MAGGSHAEVMGRGGCLGVLISWSCMVAFVFGHKSVRNRSIQYGISFDSTSVANLNLFGIDVIKLYFVFVSSSKLSKSVA